MCTIVYCTEKKQCRKFETNIQVVCCTHCNENPIYVLPEKELRGLSTNFHIHVPVSDLYILRIGPHIFLLQDRQTDRGNTYNYKSLTVT
jgi:hypothetical protein